MSVGRSARLTLAASHCDRRQLLLLLLGGDLTKYGHERQEQSQLSFLRGRKSTQREREREKKEEEEEERGSDPPFFVFSFKALSFAEECHPSTPSTSSSS